MSEMLVDKLPLIKLPKTEFWLTVIIGLFVTSISVFSLINPAVVYKTNEINQAYYPSDIGMLLFGLPFLLFSLWKLFRGKFIGIILWPSALFFILYSYALYLFGISFGPFFWLYFLITGLSLYTLVKVLVNIDYVKSSALYNEGTPVKLASIVLVGLGTLIFFRVIGLASTAFSGGEKVFQLDIGLWITDFFIAAPALIIVGIQLWKKKPFAFVAAPGLLLQYMVLSLGLFPVFIYQAQGNIASIDLGGIIVIIFMIAICVVPFIQLTKMLSEKV
jgi:hypothetical protein